MPLIALRLATVADAEQIREIYNYEVLHTTATFDLVPRTLADQQQWLADRSGAFATIVAVDTLVGAEQEPLGPAADGPTVVGFGALSAYKERAAYRTSVENSVYVRRGRQGEGIGRLLLTELLATAARSGFHTVFARINAASEASVALHRACGYEPVGIEREVGRKFGRWHDVAVMQRLL
jgi:phosphinothricin acetyltransferase